MSELPPTALTPQERKKLVDQLLGVRRVGPPPFLVRNLKYVKEHRAELTAQIWDMHSAVDHSRGTADTVRKLTLNAHAMRCILPDALYRKFQPKSPTPASTVTQGRIRIWLSVETSVGENVAFGVRENNIRLWSKSNVIGGDPIEDLTNNSQTFDLSAVCAFLDSFPSKLSVVFELYTLKDNTNLDSPLLRAEQVLFDNYHNPSNFRGTAVKNRRFKLTLDPPSKNSKPHHQPGMGMTRKPAQITHPSENDYMAMNQEESDDEIDLSGAYNVDKEIAMLETLPPNQGVVTIQVTGKVHNQTPGDISGDKNKHVNHILVECVYHSPAYPWWNGIIRHDFICPWCHRNCRRLRTLLFHFHLDHDRTELALEAIQPPEDGKNSNNGNSSRNNNEPNFILRLSVTPVGGTENTIPQLPDGATGHSSENLAVNRHKYPKYPVNSTDKPNVPDNNVVDIDMSKLRVDDGVNSMSTVEDANDLNIVPHNAQWKVCTKCRRHHFSRYRENPDFCSEFCALMHANAKLNISSIHGDKEDDDVPIMRLAKPKKRIDFDKSLGDKTLYHVVSLTPFLKDHFDEDGPDSEDEVDHSWRLRIVEDKLGCLETACAKNRVLWTMWNRYGFENYPAPGAYAERYTRYSVEKFVLEYATEIERLKLRQHLAAFLKILHIHGCIDSIAIISIFECLDGKKRLKDLKISSRPEKIPPVDPKARKQKRKTKALY